MAKTVVCPYCQMKGSLPDNFKSPRIKCPKCGETFSTTGPVSPDAPTEIRPRPKSVETVPAQARPQPKAQPKAQARPQPAAKSEAPSEEVAAVAQVAAPGARRALAGAQGASGTNPAILFALIGTSVLALFLLGILAVVFLREEPERDLPPEPPSAFASTKHDEPTNPVVAIREPTPDLIAKASPATSTVVPLPAESTRPAPTSNDPQEIIRKLKDATVYLKTQIDGKTISSGTGFVIEAQGDTVLLATNRHVAVVDLSEIPSKLTAKGSKPVLQAIIRSGQGSQVEQTLPATIVAADLSDDINTDLAFLEVRGVRQLPAPINVQSRFEPMEGLHYVGAGFPLGGMLSNIVESKSNPSVTITGGRVAALRRDDSGQLSIIQVDGSLQPGNSGGPIIDEKTGQLLGVAVAKVGAVDTIGFVVPADELRRALNGRVGAVDLTLQESPRGTAELQVRAQVVDPKRNIQSVAVHIVPAASTPLPNRRPDGSWPPLTTAKEVELSHDSQTATASGHLKVALSGDSTNARKVLVQTAFRNTQGQLIYSKPREVVLPEKPGRIHPPGQLERLLRVARRKSINLLGPLLDNSKDCVLTKDEQSFKIKIDIPGKLYTLSPQIANKQSIPIHNAPITLAEVEGDFAALVEVPGDKDPGKTPPKDPRGRKLPFTVQSSGLILYVDKDNFLRLERAEQVIPETLSLNHRLLIEFVQKGRYAVQPIYLEVPETKTLLILVKRKGRIRCLFSPDEGKSVFAFQEYAAELPSNVRVGLTAGNVSTKPFPAEFENFAILSDATKIDQEFGE